MVDVGTEGDVWSECAHGERAAILRAVRDRVILDFGVGPAFTFATPARATPTGQGAHRTNSEADGVLHDPSLSIVFRLAILAPRHGPDHAKAAVGIGG